MPHFPVVDWLRVFLLFAAFYLLSACSGRVAPIADDPCSVCQTDSHGAGACQPDNVALSQYGPTAIAAAGSSVYWTNYGRPTPNQASVMKADAGGEPIAVALNQEDVRTIAVDAHNLYWASGSLGVAQDIMSVDRNGGTPTVLAHAGIVEEVGVRGAFVYWTEGDAVRRVPTAGGEVTALATNQISARGLVVDDSHVYWSDWGDEMNPGGVFRVPIQGGEREIFSSSPTQPWALAANDAFVFVAGTTGIWRVAKTAGTPQPLVQDAQSWTLALDSSHVYWAFGAAVRAMDLSNLTITSLDAPVPPFGIGVDEARVFWTSIGSGDDNTRVRDGSVWSACKPR